MGYNIELQFLTNMLQKYNLQVLKLTKETLYDSYVDLGLRVQLNQAKHYHQLLSDAINLMKPHTIYQVSDQFGCNYVFLELAHTSQKEYLFIGPYLTESPSNEQLLDLIEQLSLPTQLSAVIERYYHVVPVIPERSTILIPVETFAEHIWNGSNNFNVRDINLELSTDSSFLSGANTYVTEDEVSSSMNRIEALYTYEKELMLAVSLGLTHKADSLFSGLSIHKFEKRSTNSVRNMQNYCIIMNTLMRKAAEQGGVHPFHLNGISTSFAHKIESLTTATDGLKLIVDIFRAYCRLVKKHSTNQYSAPIQKTILYIETNLSDNLSLKNLAKINNFNDCYLSALFKKETGKTLTDFITEQRIQRANKLLASSTLPIQTIAQNCGFSDVNYFSKTFKKKMQKSPSEYRNNTQGLFPK